MLESKSPVIHVILGITLLSVAIYALTLSVNGMKQNRYIGKSAEQKNIVTFSGEGRVTVTPDIARLTLGVISEAPTVAAAQSDAVNKMNKIVAAVKNAGVEAADIQTRSFTINPKYDYSEGQNRIIGYTVATDAVVKIRNFDNIGSMIALATNNGANQVSGPDFTIDQPEKLEDQARQEAITKAKARASNLARELGLKLGPIVQFNDNGGGTPPIMYALGNSDMAARGEAAPAPTVEAGSQDVVVSVTIGFEVY